MQDGGPVLRLRHYGTDASCQDYAWRRCTVNEFNDSYNDAGRTSVGMDRDQQGHLGGQHQIDGYRGFQEQVLLEGADIVRRLRRPRAQEETCRARQRQVQVHPGVPVLRYSTHWVRFPAQYSSNFGKKVGGQVLADGRVPRRSGVQHP